MAVFLEVDDPGNMASLWRELGYPENKAEFCEDETWSSLLV
jgi:hypothetical protein